MFSKGFIKSGFRFLISGILITLCDFILFKILGHWGVAASLARIGSFAIALFLAFIVHHCWTFKMSQSWTQAIVPYLQSRLGSFLLAQGAFMLMHDGFGWSDNLSFAIQTPIQPLVNFLAGYFYVFKERDALSPSSDKRWWLEIIFAPVLLFIILIIPFRNTRMQHPIWVVPYTSGAANWSLGQPWKVALGDDVLYKEKSIEQRWVETAHPTNDSTKLIPFSAHDEGWMWIVWFTRKIFPFLSDLQGAVLLAVILHLTLSCLILNRLSPGWSRYLFTLIFICNPLTIHLVSFPYYYYWQAFPSLLVIIVWLYREKIKVWYIPGLALFLALCVAVRPNVIFITLLVLGLTLYFIRHWITYLSVTLFVLGFLLIPKTNKMLWHTVYSGLGAYPNSSGLYLSDESSYDSFKKKTGITLDTSLGANYYNPQLRDTYNQHLKNESVEYAKTHPIHCLKNIFLNLSIGTLSPYKPNAPVWVYYMQSILGIMFFVGLIWFRQWLVIAGLVLSLGCIGLIYPPIAAYIVGSLVFTAWGVTSIISKITSHFSKE
jgi:putative flippase GtrA